MAGDVTLPAHLAVAADRLLSGYPDHALSDDDDDLADAICAVLRGQTVDREPVSAWEAWLDCAERLWVLSADLPPDMVAPSVAYAVARGEKSSKSVPMSTRRPPWAIVTSTDRPVSWLRAKDPGLATQAGSGTASNIRT